MKLSLLFFLTIFHLCRLTKNEYTSINGTVVPHRIESTWPLKDANLVLIIKQDTNHEETHHLRLNVNQSSFPFHFIMKNITEIKNNGLYLLSLLIFGKPHRLLWEGVFFRQHLTVNHVNSITFIVQDVSNLPKCLSEDYPCIVTNEMPNELMSVCCSDTKCQYSNKNDLKKATCGGRSPAVLNVILTYILPDGMKPKCGLLGKTFISDSQINYQAISVPGTIITVSNATIHREFRNMRGSHYPSSGKKYVMQIHLSITSSATCNDCQDQTLRSIEHKQVPFNIPLEDDTSIIIMIQTYAVQITGILATSQTTPSRLTTAFVATPTHLTRSSTTLPALVTTTATPSTLETLSPTSAAVTSASLGWSTTSSMRTARAFHTASVLPGGKVLVVGGSNYTEKAEKSAELYDQATGNWTSVGNMSNRRAFHTASVLSDGRVLVVGGVGVSPMTTISAELYNPATGNWTSAGNMSNRRVHHTASVLLDDRVLVVGGTGFSSMAEKSAELYDPAIGNWTSVGNMSNRRVYHTASVLLDGRVLVAGGTGVSSMTAISAELYDPATGNWTSVGNMSTTRVFHTASVLSDGKVLVVGGIGDFETIEKSTELYDPATGNWTLAGNMSTARGAHTASLLDGKVLVVGGSDDSEMAEKSAELYDPATGNWTSVGNMSTARVWHTASVLAGDKVLVAGGKYNMSHDLYTAELYYP